MYVLYVFLADNEWAGQDTGNKMWNVAKEYFQKYPTQRPLVVHVSEHAGWWLEYLEDGTIVGSANDRAILSDEAKQFWKAHKAENWQHLPTVRRM